MLDGPVRAEISFGGGGSIGQGHPDRRSPSVVYISEQMAFIYIFQKRSDLGLFAFYRSDDE